MTDPDFVWITRTSRSNRVFHTDRDCRFLPTDPTRRRRPPLERMGYEECKACGGGHAGGGNIPDRSIYQAAVEAGGSSDD